MLKTVTWYPRSLVTLTWYRPESLADTLTSRKVPLGENSSFPLVSFFRITADGGKLMVRQKTVTFCPSWTTRDGRTRTVVFLGGAKQQESVFLDLGVVTERRRRTCEDDRRSGSSETR